MGILEEKLKTLADLFIKEPSRHLLRENIEEAITPLRNSEIEARNSYLKLVLSGLRISELNKRTYENNRRLKEKLHLPYSCSSLYFLQDGRLEIELKNFDEQSIGAYFGIQLLFHPFLLIPLVTDTSDLWQKALGDAAWNISLHGKLLNDWEGNWYFSAKVAQEPHIYGKLAYEHDSVRSAKIPLSRYCPELGKIKHEFNAEVLHSFFGIWVIKVLTNF